MLNFELPTCGLVGRFLLGKDLARKVKKQDAIISRRILGEMSSGGYPQPQADFPLTSVEIRFASNSAPSPTFSVAEESSKDRTSADPTLVPHVERKMSLNRTGLWGRNIRDCTASTGEQMENIAKI